MSLSPSRVADILATTAQLLHEHGPATTRRVHELSLAAGGSSDGRSSQGDHSDPTYRQATTHDPLSGLQGAWEARNRDLWGYWAPTTPLASMGRLGGYGGIWAVHACQLFAQRVRCGALNPPPTIGQLFDTACRIQDLIYEAMPIDREAAEEELREADYLARRSDYCAACESPIDGTTVKNVSGLCRPGCYDLEQRQIQRGRYIDRATFIDTTRAGVARGEIDRPASPYWRTAVPIVHEGEPAA